MFALALFVRDYDLVCLLLLGRGHQLRTVKCVRHLLCRLCDARGVNRRNDALEAFVLDLLCQNDRDFLCAVDDFSDNSAGHLAIENAETEFDGVFYR